MPTLLRSYEMIGFYELSGSSISDTSYVTILLSSISSAAQTGSLSIYGFSNIYIAGVTVSSTLQDVEVKGNATIFMDGVSTRGMLGYFLVWTPTPPAPSGNWVPVSSGPSGDWTPVAS